LVASTYQHGEGRDEGSESIEGDHLERFRVERVVEEVIVFLCADVKVIVVRKIL
jgi:hypothetical protein